MFVGEVDLADHGFLEEGALGVGVGGTGVGEATAAAAREEAAVAVGGAGLLEVRERVRRVRGDAAWDGDRR